jgi:hypothetical protein
MKIRDVALTESALFLKSEYGPLSDSWPAVAFTMPNVKAQIDRQYRSGVDFILYTGTAGPETDQPYRKRLLSLARLDKMRAGLTEQLIPQTSWDWAQEKYPGKWKYAYGVLEGWSITAMPLTSEILPESYPRIGEFPYRGSILRITEVEKQRLLDMTIEPVSLSGRPFLRQSHTLDALLRNPDLNVTATRIAELIYNRVDISGTQQTRIAPLRNAPSDLTLQVANLLGATPLLCALCGGDLPMLPANRLLQPSPDRIDSSSGSYAIENFQLTHLACNLAKSNATPGQFDEWMTVAAVGFACGTTNNQE